MGGPSSKMFMKLFRYILGVNQEAVEIEMTRPVPTSVIPVENNLVDQEMCFWLGTPYESKEAPLAIDKKVTIEEKPELTFYVSQFNGYMFSHQIGKANIKILKIFYRLMTTLIQIQMFGIILVMILHGLLLMSEEMRFGFQLLKQKIQTQFNSTSSFNGIFLISYVLLCMIMNLKEYEYTYLH